VSRSECKEGGRSSEEGTTSRAKCLEVYLRVATMVRGAKAIRCSVIVFYTVSSWTLLMAQITTTPVAVLERPIAARAIHCRREGDKFKY